jgi:hypothetical protein
MLNRIKFIFKFSGITIALIVLLLFGIKYYVENNKNLVFQKFEEWYSEHYYGKLTFDDISSTTFKNFPNISFKVTNFTLSDTISSLKSGAIQIEEIYLSVSFKNLLDKDIHFKSLTLKNGSLRSLILTDTVSTRKLFSKKNIDTLSKVTKSQNWFSNNGMILNTENIDVSIVDNDKHKRITAHINNLNAQLFMNDSLFKTSIKLNIQMKEMGLNTEKGTFFNDANLVGNLDATLNKNTKNIDIPIFNLAIDKQHFKVKSTIETTTPGTFEFVIENEATNFDSTINLLTNHLQEKLKKVKVLNPLYTHTTIKGSFAKGSQPAIAIDCKAVNNTVTINNEIYLRNISFEGDFTNSIASKSEKNPKDFQINLNNLKTSIDSIFLNFKSVSMLSLVNNHTNTPTMQIAIKKGDFLVKDDSKNKRISGFINNLETTLQSSKNAIKGHTIMDIEMKEMGLNLNNGTFFNNANVSGNFPFYFQKNKALLTIPLFNLNIDNQTFNTKVIISTKGFGSFDICLENLTTNFKNTTALLAQNIQKKLKIYTIENPIYTYTQLTGSFEPKSNPLVIIHGKTEGNNITIKDKYTFENVLFSVNFVNRIYNNGVTNNNRKKDIQLTFNKLNVTYDSINLIFNHATISSSPEINTFADYEFEVHQSANILNDFFKNTEYLFQDGTIDLSTRFKGEVTNLNNLFYTSNSSLSITKSNLLQKPLALIIPIEKLKIEIINQNGFLETLKIPINNTENNIDFKGEITNVVPLILGEKASISTNVEATSNNIIWGDFFSMFKQSHKLKNSTLKKEDEFIFNETFRAVYTKFNPKFKLFVDRFQYQKTVIDSLISEVDLNSKQLSLKNIQFNYGKGNVDLEMIFDISVTDKTAFDLSLDIQSINLNRFLTEFNYFELKSLKEAKKVEGIISLSSKMKGEIHEVNGLITQSLIGDVTFNLNNLELDGFLPIENIGNKIFKKKRFEAIRFANISETIKIANRTVQIPRVEIQSTAFNLFAEGQLSYNFDTNIWISIPLSNIKKRDLISIPNKKGYVNSGKKVYVQVIDDGSGKLEYKFHLGDKKLHEYRTSLIKSKN